MRAVRFDAYGGLDVLDVREVDDPVATPDRVLIEVKAAAINPGEIAIREGSFRDRWPATFPSGEGSDFAGIVREVGDGASGVAPGDKVLGWSDERSSHAELVAVPAGQVTAKPEALSWEVAGSLYVAGLTAVASVQAVAPQPGETIAVSAAAGGVGSIAVQLARLTGATVVGLASEANHEWLRSRGVLPVCYGEGQAERIREATGGKLDGFIDTFGGGYVQLAVELGVAPQRINTIADVQAAERYGTHAQGGHTIATASLLAELARLVAEGQVEVPIARVYPLDRVREAYRQLAKRDTRGKIVLVP